MVSLNTFWLKVLEAPRATSFPYTRDRGCPKGGFCGTPLAAPSVPPFLSLLCWRPSSPFAPLPQKGFFGSSKEGRCAGRWVASSLSRNKSAVTAAEQALQKDAARQAILHSSEGLTKCEQKTKDVLSRHRTNKDVKHESSKIYLKI